MPFTTTPLLVFNDVPFNFGTQCDALDVLTADGVNTTYDVSYKAVTSIAGTVQAQNLFLKQIAPASGNPGFFRTSTGIQTTSILPIGTKVMIPGINRFRIGAYDQATLAGSTTPANTQIEPFFICDPVSIASNMYTKTGTNTGIQCQVVDNDPTNSGASASWCQLGFANPSTGAAPSSWANPGDPIFFPELRAQDSVQSNIASGATSVTVGNGTQFTLVPTQQCVQFIRYDQGLSNQEDVRVTSISSNTINHTPTTYAHTAGAIIYQIAFGGYMLLTLPTPANGPITYYDMSIDLFYDAVSR